MPKFTFQCDTLGNFTFRCDTWAGGGAPPPSPSFTLQDLFCHAFESQADFQQFVTDANAIIADPSTVSAADLAYLDLYDDGVFGYDDRDAWLHYLMREAHPVTLTAGRLPWADPTPENFAESDPMGLATGRTNIIIMDHLNQNAIKITRGTNNCTLQDGVTSDGSLWDTNPDVYRRTLWFNLEQLDEGNYFFGGGGVSTRRFPTNGGEVTIYIRGGTQTTKEQTVLVKQNAGWTAQTKIIIRGYPGEVTAIRSGSAEVAAFPGKYHGGIINPPDSPGESPYSRVIRRSNVTIEGITFQGNRDIGGGLLVFDLGMFYAHGTDWDNVTALNGLTIRKCTIIDILGLSPSDPNAASFPQYVDQAYLLRINRFTGVSVNSANGILGAMIRSFMPTTKIIQCFGRVAPANFPMPAAQIGEGMGAMKTATNSLIQRVTIEGTVAHGAMGIAGDNSIIEYCDVENYHNTMIGFRGENVKVRYNRVHAVTHESRITTGMQCTPVQSEQFTTSGQVYGNVVWGWQGFDGGVGSPNSGLNFSRTKHPSEGGPPDGGGGEINGYEVFDNIFYGCGMNFYDALMGNVVKNINVHDNVFVNVPSWNAANPTLFNACITLQMLDPELSSFWGSQFRNNLFYRTDGFTHVMTEGGTFYSVAQLNTLPNCSGNIWGNPMFTDPTNGIFTFISGSSPAYDNITADPNIPLLPFSDPDLLHGVCDIHVCAEINVGPQYDCKIEVTPKHSAKISAGPRYTCEISVHECD